jgi:DNA-binding NtrC family response regulator
MTQPARLLVCERHGRWAVALRQKLAEAGVRLTETRSLAECRAEIEISPASFVVLELTRKNLDELLQTVRNWPRDYPSLRWIVVADRSLADREEFLREAGATHFTCSPRQASRLAQLTCNHLAQIPPPPQSLTERILSSLPWSP